jgi:predicted ester cyclase
VLAEGDKVAVRWTGSGTHGGPFGNLAPTGKQVTIRGISIARVADGKVVEEWENTDESGVMQQLA